MRIENTDRFRNKYCQVNYKDGCVKLGTILYIPNYSSKYNYHPVGWWLVPVNLTWGEEMLTFGDIESITVLE